MSISLKDRAAIAGIGLTEFSRDSGVSELNLAAQCITVTTTHSRPPVVNRLNGQ